MLMQDTKQAWSEFLQLIKNKTSPLEFQNWFSPIQLLETSDSSITLEVPNIFLQEYLLENYKAELTSLLPTKSNGDPAIDFVIKAPEKKAITKSSPKNGEKISEKPPQFEVKLNHQYTFSYFIEGPSNQFVKSAALGVAARPGQSYNPLFIHGGVGLGKTHLLHSIGHEIKTSNPRMKVQCITTEAFINDLVHNLRNKSVAQMKRYYRSLDILLVDDIQFLQSRLNFEEEFCNTFEALINQNKQIVITSDKPPSQLNLSERLIARMEWGLVANVGIPDLETRVAILHHKADKIGLKLTQQIAFFIAEHIFANVRQLEGAINRLSAYCGMMETELTQEIVESILGEMFQFIPKKKITVESILRSVSSMFNVRVQDLRGSSRARDIAFPRQVAMYLAKELISESLIKISSSFGGKTHSTLLHSWKKISKQLESDNTLRKQIQMTKKNLEA